MCRFIEIELMNGKTVLANTSKINCIGPNQKGDYMVDSENYNWVVTDECFERLRQELLGLNIPVEEEQTRAIRV